MEIRLLVANRRPGRVSTVGLWLVGRAAVPPGTTGQVTPLEQAEQLFGNEIAVERR